MLFLPSTPSSFLPFLLYCRTQCFCFSSAQWTEMYSAKCVCWYKKQLSQTDAMHWDILLQFTPYVYRCQRLLTHIISNNTTSVNVTDSKCPMWTSATSHLQCDHGHASCAPTRGIQLNKDRGIFYVELFCAVSDRSPSQLDSCGLRRFHFPTSLRSYLNGLYNNLLCPETTQQIIILCSNVWQQKLVTITKRAGVFLPGAPPRRVPAAEKVVYKASIDFETISQRINKTGEEGGLSHELFDQSTCHSWN